MYMEVYGSFLRSMEVYGGIWWYLQAYGTLGGLRPVEETRVNGGGGG